MADLNALQQKRQNLLAEIQRRGGRGKAPNFEQQLAQVEAQIRQARPAASKQGNLRAGYNLSPKPVQKQLAANQQAAQTQAQAAIPYQNPNLVNPFYSQTTEFDAQGNPVIKQNLTDAQQQLLTGGQNLSLQGLGLAGQALSGFKPFSMGQDVVADRQRIEDEVFNRLTRGSQQDYDREKQQLEQTLYNRGIPLNPADPQYKANMDALNERFDTMKANARAQATELGGQELQRSYGMGLGTHQQGLADVGALQNLGIGFQTPQAPNYQAPNMPFVTPSELQLALEQLKLQRQQLSRSGGGGGGGGAAPQAPSPFNAGLPPGYSGGVA